MFGLFVFVLKLPDSRWAGGILVSAVALLVSPAEVLSTGSTPGDGCDFAV